MSEEYSGVKFSVDFMQKAAPILSPNLEKLIKWCRIFDHHQLAPPYPGGSAGNLSFRVKPNHSDFIITGSKIGLKNNLSENQFVQVTNVHFLDKMIEAIGLIEPSSESMLHWAIYKQRPDVNAIFHGHSQVILNKAKKKKWTTTKKEVPYGTCQLVDEVVGILGNSNFLIIKNHGFVAMEKSIDATGSLCLKHLQE